MTKDLSALILGTRSGPRLKTPVPLLPFGETTVLNRTLTAYLDAGFAEVVLVLGSRAAEVRESLGVLAERVRVVEAGETEERFAELLRAGLDKVAASSKGLVLGLGDQPLLQHELLVDLAAQFQAGKAKILAPSWQGHLGSPVFIDAALTGGLKKIPADTSLWDILKSNASTVDSREVAYVSVVRAIEDRGDYHEMLRTAGLPVPEPEHGFDEEEADDQDGGRARAGAGGGSGGNGGAPQDDSDDDEEDEEDPPEELPDA